MIIIGEKLNSSIPGTFEALSAKDGAFVRDLTARQIAGGAQYLDVNAAMCGEEKEMLAWMVETAREEQQCNFMIDSPNPEAIRYVYEHTQLEDSIINSVTLERERFDGIVPLVKEYNTGIVAMPIDEGGMPHDAATRVANAGKLIERLNGEGISNERIYVDIVVEAAGAAWDAPKAALDAARELRAAYPDVHLTAGLSNISFGLPNRAVINRAFLCFCMANGVDSAILDPTNRELMLTLRAADVMNGKDEFCMEYLTAYRALFG